VKYDDNYDPTIKYAVVLWHTDVNPPQFEMVGTFDKLPEITFTINDSLMPWHKNSFTICGDKERRQLNASSFFALSNHIKLLSARWCQQYDLCWIGISQRLGYLIQQITGSQGLKKSNSSLKEQLLSENL
ncbi:hypothetical protein QQF64_031572, partial [Cirrhinus molitorella]